MNFFLTYFLTCLLWLNDRLNFGIRKTKMCLDMVILLSKDTGLLPIQSILRTMEPLAVNIEQNLILFCRQNPFNHRRCSLFVLSLSSSKMLSNCVDTFKSLRLYKSSVLWRFVW